jgi:hypothetical protein
MKKLCIKNCALKTHHKVASDLDFLIQMLLSVPIKYFVDPKDHGWIKLHTLLTIALLINTLLKIAIEFSSLYY